MTVSYETFSKVKDTTEHNTDVTGKYFTLKTSIVLVESKKNKISKNSNAILFQNVPIDIKMQ